MVSLWVSVWRESIEVNLVAPVTILAASFDSYCVQLYHTKSAYSSSGRINEK